MPLFPAPVISLPVYRSEAEPHESFPLGGIWHEIISDSSGDKYLKEIWIKERLDVKKNVSGREFGDFWISTTKYQLNFALSSYIGANTAFRVPPDQYFDYFFQEANAYCLYFTSNPVNAQNYWRVVCTILGTSSSFIFFNTGLISNSTPLKTPISMVVSTGGQTQIAVTFAKVGVPPDGQISFSLDYRRIRK
jgi:hypothetical protein